MARTSRVNSLSVKVRRPAEWPMEITWARWSRVAVEHQVGADHVLVEQFPADEAGGVGAEVGEHGLRVGLHRGALVAPGAGALHDQAAA